MRRRRLAWLLAFGLAVVALLLGIGLAVLKLSPRDYRLAWRLRHTMRIEYSNPWHGSRVIEISEPKEVATIVSSMTTKLDRLPKRRMARLPSQARFFLDDGNEIAVALVPRASYASPREATFVRLPGETDFRCYETSIAFDEVLGTSLRDANVEVGPLHVEGIGDIALGLDLYWSSFAEGFRRHCLITSKWPKGAARWIWVELRCTQHRGPRHGLWEAWKVLLGPDWSKDLDVFFDLDEIDTFEATPEGGETVSLPVARVRFHDLLVPPCPTCGSSMVVPCVYHLNGSSSPPFKGRCMLYAEHERPNSPQFYCEECRAPF